VKKRLIEWGGWYGVGVILLAFALSSFSLIKPTDLIYQILNLTGALGISVASLYKQAYQPAILNIIWMLIALIAVAKIFLHI